MAHYVHIVSLRAQGDCGVHSAATESLPYQQALPENTIPKADRHHVTSNNLHHDACDLSEETLLKAITASIPPRLAQRKQVS